MKILFKLLCGLVIFANNLSAQNTNSGYIKVGSDSIFYETAGKGPAIIMIHDGLVHSAIWDEQFAFFSKDHKVIRYDRRGYGNSSAVTEAFSNVDDLKQVFSYLSISNACLIAMSSGGRLAIDFTLQYPKMVNSLVLVGAVVGGFTYTNHFFTRGGHLPANLSDPVQRGIYYASEDPYEIYSGNIKVKEKVTQLIKDFPRKTIHFHSPESAEKNIQPELPSYKRLNEIKIPALILVGEFDMPDVHAHSGVINAGIINSERDIIPNSGHLIPIEQPELFNTAVKKFVDGLSD